MDRLLMDSLIRWKDTEPQKAPDHTRCKAGWKDVADAGIRKNLLLKHRIYQL